MFWEKLPTVTPELGSCDPAGLSARKGGELRTQCNSGQDVLPKEERRARKGDLKTSDDLATLYLGPVVCVCRKEAALRNIPAYHWPASLSLKNNNKKQTTLNPFITGNNILETREL